MSYVIKNKNYNPHEYFYNVPSFFGSPYQEVLFIVIPIAGTYSFPYPYQINELGPSYLRTRDGIFLHTGGHFLTRVDNGYLWSNVTESLSNNDTKQLLVIPFRMGLIRPIILVNKQKDQLNVNREQS